MTTKREIFKREICEGALRSSESPLGNGKADLTAGSDPRPGEGRNCRSHWKTALWAFAIAGWGVLACLYHSHRFSP